MTDLYLTSTTEAPIVNANTRISSNCYLPNTSGTQTWAVPTQAIDLSIWFIPMPPPEGWGNIEHFTQEQMMADVDMTNIVEQEYNPAWFPTPPEEM